MFNIGASSLIFLISRFFFKRLGRKKLILIELEEIISALVLSRTDNLSVKTSTVKSGLKDRLILPIFTGSFREVLISFSKVGLYFSILIICGSIEK